MTPQQRVSLKVMLKRAGVSRLLNGACIGADEEAAGIAKQLGIKLDLHPGKPLGHPKRADIKNYASCRLVEDPLKRNRIMVNLGDMLFATPGEYEEQLRSGTWYTIRYARQQEKQVVIIFPKGEVQVEQTDY